MINFPAGHKDLPPTTLAKIREWETVIDYSDQQKLLDALAKEAKKPYYVAAESYKFCRLYPLSPTDLPKAESEASPKQVFVGGVCW